VSLVIFLNKRQDLLLTWCASPRCHGLSCHRSKTIRTESMLSLDPLIVACALIPVGALAAWLVCQQRTRHAHTALQIELQTAQNLLATQSQTLLTLREERQAAQARAQLCELENVRLQAEMSAQAQRLEETRSVQQEWMQRAQELFQNQAAEVLQRSQNHLMEAAQQRWAHLSEQVQQDWKQRSTQIESGVQPVTAAVERLESRILELERLRAGAYEGLQVQLGQLLQSEQTLQLETAKLVQALKAPQVRGRWGEIQLKRVVELAGMLNHCDFQEQVHLVGEEGRLRPDLVVRLPGKKSLVVDSKAPLESYLAAMETPDEEIRRQHLADHARRIRCHIQELSKKSYWEQFEQSPEFVILFLPGEPFFSAALQHDPSLIEVGVEQRVILATPTTLIALLRSAAYGWRHEQLSKNAQEISSLGKELYKRLCDMGEHWAKVGRHLKESVECYNRSIGSLEHRVWVTARKFRDLQTLETEIPELSPIEQHPRQIQAPEWQTTSNQISLSQVEELLDPQV
jgi:DNA recombination protein RmuC